MLSAGSEVQVAGQTRRIDRCAGTERAPILRLAGVADREAAQALRGMEIAVSVEQLPPLPEGELWAHQLEGCEVCDGPLRVGAVAQLIELPSCEALEVRREHGGTLLVPMVGDAIRDIDLKRRQIDIDMGFLGEAA